MRMKTVGGIVNAGMSSVRHWPRGNYLPIFIIIFFYFYYFFIFIFLIPHFLWISPDTWEVAELKVLAYVHIHPLQQCEYRACPIGKAKHLR
jgi:hypothetical protein